jgi:hypothetical protein
VKPITLSDAALAMLRELDCGETVLVQDLSAYANPHSGGQLLRTLVEAGYAIGETVADINSNLRFERKQPIGPDSDDYFEAEITEAGIAYLKGEK